MVCKLFIDLTDPCSDPCSAINLSEIPGASHSQPHPSHRIAVREIKRRKEETVFTTLNSLEEGCYTTMINYLN